MKNKLKVVIDTNIFMYGWFSENKTFCTDIMELVEAQKLHLLFAQDTIGELMYISKNFARFHIDEEDERILLLQNIAELFHHSTSVNTVGTKSVELHDDNDNMFLKCAVKGQADYLISDDFKSGLHDDSILTDSGIKVVSSEEFIKIFKE